MAQVPRRALRPGAEAQLLGDEMLTPRLSPQRLRLPPSAPGSGGPAPGPGGARGSCAPQAPSPHRRASWPSATERCCQQPPPVTFPGSARGGRPLSPCQLLPPFTVQEWRQRLPWTSGGQVRPYMRGLAPSTQWRGGAVQPCTECSGPPAHYGDVGQYGLCGGLSLAGCQVPSQPLSPSPTQKDRGKK